MAAKTRKTAPAAAPKPRQLFGETTARECLEHVLDVPTKEFEKAKTDFLANAALDPGRTIEWSASSMIKAQTKHLAAGEIRRILDDTTVESSLLARVERALDFIAAEFERALSHGDYKHNSTCPFTNATRATAFEARCDFFRNTRGELRYVAKELKKDAEQAADEAAATEAGYDKLAGGWIG